MDDEVFMRGALRLAELGRGSVSPNPLVGAMVVRGGFVVGEGWHEGPGRPHAEILALRDAGDQGRGATLYTTLEPCDHYGRTPPCSVSIVSAGVTRVVAALRDPNPIVDGRGFDRLRSAGVVVDTPVLELEARRQNEAFLRHITTGMPFVTLKMAATLDGKVAARDGSSRWITGSEARAQVHAMRAAADAIMIGAGTVLADDAALTVRDPSYRGAPVLRVLLDSRGRTPPQRALFSDEAPTLVATTAIAPLEVRERWRDAGAEVVVYGADPAGVPLVPLLADLGKRDIQSVLLEGGPTLAWSAVTEDLVDKIVLFLAPSLAGGRAAPGILGGEGFAPISAARRVRISRVDRVGDDIRVEADVHRDR